MNGERSVKRVTGTKDFPERFRLITMTFLIVVAIAGRARTDNSSLNSGSRLLSLEMINNANRKEAVGNGGDGGGGGSGSASYTESNSFA
ncbi:hypothetical protein M0802_001249 [Mischocyttarus mexicanus]|nr:hypothetical protein M0802_001249 [Mischocyttarus mexicanus]